MMEKRMQETLLKDGFVFSLAECGRILRAVDAVEPWVGKFHKAIRSTIMRHRQLETSWGWRLNFDCERLTDSSVYRRGYAYLQQSEIGVLMKQWGLLTYWQQIHPQTWDGKNCYGPICATTKRPFKSRLNMLVHDNVVLSCPKEELYDVASILVAALVRPRSYGVRSGLVPAATAEIAIPAEIKVSRRLSCTCGECEKAIEFGALPAREAFYKEVEKL